MKREYTLGSLFTGIGGFDLGAKQSGIKTIWQSEINPFACKILKQNFDAENYGDIRTIKKPKRVSIISGGFPCQDISINGKGDGINGAKSGLWSEMLRIVRIVRPRYIVIENSSALTFRGFERLLCELSECGYDAQWQSISNAEFGYAHRRERLYIIAYSNSLRPKKNIQFDGKTTPIFKEWTSEWELSISISKRFFKKANSNTLGIDDGFSDWSHRAEALGNAVNPAICHYLFECIKQYDKNFLK